MQVSKPLKQILIQMLAASAFFGKPLELQTVRPCDVPRRVVQVPVVTTRIPSSVKCKMV